MTTREGGSLVLGDDGAGQRHTLGGRPVHAGTLLELLQPDGTWMLGRYEWSWRHGERPRFYLGHGHEHAPVMLDPEARLRWPTGLLR